MFKSGRMKDRDQIEIFQYPTQLNRDNYHNERRENSRTLRNRKRNKKGKLMEIDQQ